MTTFADPHGFFDGHFGGCWHQIFASVLQIVPASARGVDEVNFRQMESGSMHNDPHPTKKATGGGEKNATLRAGKRNKNNNVGDDDMETAPPTPSSMTDKEDLFGAFANVTLHYDGET